MRSIRLRAVLLLAALSTAVAAAEPGINIFVASRAYIVSVAPVDEESKNAENSILYQRVGKDTEWIALGPCRKEARPGGQVRFTREVDVDADGVYQYTSRPVVGGEVASPPHADSPPQAVVVVDTLAPAAEITAPAEGFAVEPGTRVDVSWTSSDEHLGPLPAALSYTTDGGRSWNPIGSELPAAGDMTWSAPDDLDRPAVIRLAVVDRAGNTGRDLRRVDNLAPAAKAPVTPDLPPLAETPRYVPPAAPPIPADTVLEEEPPPAPKEKLRDPNRSWLYYLMAINLMRQNKPADALQYYWLSVKEDPDFINAWADIGLAYIDLGAYRTAREVVEQTRDKAPDRIDLIHLLGETYHAEGMALLGEARTPEDRMRAKGLIDRAVEWYGRALEAAAKDWRLAEQAASFYRLGEVCYYVNMDRDGARAYWKKILELHSPTPNPDLVLWTPRDKRDEARQRQERYIYMRVSLDAWQNWARGYLEQLDARERAGILDLMPAQRISAIACPPELNPGATPINPGRDDGRSLFSLPGQLGSPEPVAAIRAESGGGRPVSGAAYQSTATEQYSFYAGKDARGRNARDAAPARKAGRDSLFNGGPDQPPPPNPDPYAFPMGGRQSPGWMGYGAYGNQPANDW